MVRLFQHHQAMGLRDNGLASPWYTWPILWHPIIVKFAAHGLGSTYTSTLSNLALWAVADLALLGAPIVAIADKIRALLGKKRWVDAELVRSLLLAEAGWLALWAPWMVGRGNYTFHYHEFPSLCFARR